jgi:hypothetical protein
MSLTFKDRTGEPAWMNRQRTLLCREQQDGHLAHMTNRSTLAGVLVGLYVCHQVITGPWSWSVL